MRLLGVRLWHNVDGAAPTLPELPPWHYFDFGCALFQARASSLLKRVSTSLSSGDRERCLEEAVYKKAKESCGRQ